MFCGPSFSTLCVEICGITFRSCILSRYLLIIDRDRDSVDRGGWFPLVGWLVGRSVGRLGD